MGAGSVLSGLIAMALGVTGILGMYGFITYPIPLAALVDFFGFGLTFLMFAAIAVVGVIVIIEGSMTERIVAVPATAAMGRVVAMTSLDLTILQLISEGKSAREISRITGVSRHEVEQRMSILRSEGYLTRDHHLTASGYDAIKPGEIVVERPES
jgi:DNA-binding CsgD family transcriptional regulator